MRVHEIHGGWGHHIEWFSWDKREVHGHLPDPPNKGDLLTAEMQSGKVAVFEFVSVDRMSDPPDQFFAKVKDIGYADDEPARSMLAPRGVGCMGRELP